MKDPFEVLRRKEAEIELLRKEIEALRLVGKLLSERKQSGGGEAPRGKVLEILTE
jgi:hypothetical protein